MSTPPSPAAAPRDEHDNRWSTAITAVATDQILVRGYRIDELMGRLSFGQAIYLLLVGELPSPTVGRVMDALLISSIDHGAHPPSTVAARTVAGTGAPLRAAAAAGTLALGSSLGGGGNIAPCMQFLDSGLALVGEWVSYDDAARRLLDQWSGTTAPPGFGHRIHDRDPRAARLMQIAFELELEGGHTQLARAAGVDLTGHRLPGRLGHLVGGESERLLGRAPQVLGHGERVGGARAPPGVRRESLLGIGATAR